jgi:lipid II:glycine glycyltransferase (peptidoglycan interpeptide bridge formation enzyme)
MRKTTKTTKTAKTKTIKKDVKAAARIYTPLEMVREAAVSGIRFGLGLGAYLMDNPQKNFNVKLLRGNVRENLNTFVTSAINKGEKIEKEQVEKLMNFEREQRERIKAFLDARRQYLKKTETTLEEKIEEVIASLDIPSRQDIHQLNRRLNELSRELARQRTTKSTHKTAKRAKHSSATEVQSA